MYCSSCGHIMRDIPSIGDVYLYRGRRAEIVNIVDEYIVEILCDGINVELPISRLGTYLSRN